nr:glycosyltransferase family 4 protein [Shimia biformata]
MKSPNHAVPSGDREMARGLMAALARDGAEVALVSEFQTRDGRGDADAQARIKAGARDEVLRLTATGGWDLWVTYHNYYKAPDLVGPAVSAELGIPYVIVEPSRADKRLTGPWADFERAAGAACDTASVLFHLTQEDREVLARHARPNQVIRHLAPFLNMETLPDAQTAPLQPVILTAGMMRHRDKLASYERLAEALTRLPDEEWSLHVAGDGPARAEVEALFQPFGGKVRWLGQLDRAGMQAAYRNATCFVWPGVNEAFGMVYLEAQAQGCPALAEAYPGPASVMPAGTATQVGDATALAAAITRLIAEPTHRQNAAVRARKFMEDGHLITAARQTLWSELSSLLKGVA